MLFLPRVLQLAGRRGMLFRGSPVGLSLRFSVREIRVTILVTVLVTRRGPSRALVCVMPFNGNMASCSPWRALWVWGPLGVGAWLDLDGAVELGDVDRVRGAARQSCH